MSAARTLAVLAALAAGCGSPRPPPLDASLPIDLPAPEVSAPDVSAPDVSAPEVSAPDVPAPDVPAPDLPAPDVPGPRGCEEYRLTDQGGSLASPELNETSGVVASRRNPGVYFVHNDSGDSARFFAINLTGAVLGEYRLAGVTAVDWEDIARIPCGASACVVLGDVGDNGRVRASVALYRVEEPAAPPSTPGPVTVPFTVLRFRYPDGAHNAETLVGDPATGELYVVTKVDQGRVTVYRAPREDNGVATRVGEMDLPASAGQLTAGDVRDDGQALLLRTYARVLRYDRPAGAGFEGIFAGVPTALPSRIEPQGEAVAWTHDGDGYLTISEGTSVRINVFRCGSP